MKKLGRRIYHPICSKKFEAWYETDGDQLIPVDVRRYKNFKFWDETVYCFRYKNRLYTEDGIDHFNGHFSCYTDRSALYGVYLREVVEV